MSTKPLVPAVAAALLLITAAQAQTPPAFPPPATHDGSHDFDFLIGDWKAHLKRLPDRLVGSTTWLEYDGVSKTHKIFGSDANLEAFEVRDLKDNLSIRAQTLRLYDPKSRQWSIYGLDVDKGALGLPATVGAFHDGVGELYDMEPWGGRMILVRYQWRSRDRDHAHFEQAFSADGGRTWEVNWICDLTRDRP